MIKYNLQQGSDAWHQFRLDHFGASEAAAMLGLSSKVTRNELLHAKHTGIAKEFSDFVQTRILDRGHEVEALTRSIVESDIGEDLYPVTCSEGNLSASCDGLTISGDTAFECKQWNAELAAAVEQQELPEEFMPQCQQILMVTGAEFLIFAVSDGTRKKIVQMSVYPDQEWFQRLMHGWAQFASDLAAYVPSEIVEKPIADAIVALPALFIQARGEITASNMDEFGRALATSLATVRAAQLITDQDFSNAEAAAKLYRETGKKLMLAKEAMLEQTLTIGAAARMIDAWHEDLRVTALKLEKDVEREKESKKLAILSIAKGTYLKHTIALEAEIAPIRLVLPQPDFAGAMKGKRLVSAWQDAVDTVLANAKIEADAVAKDVRGKLAWCKENAAGMSFLFSDLQQIIVKPMDDFKLVVTTRIEAHKQAEAAKLEAERERIRAEEEVKARAKVEAETNDQRGKPQVSESEPQAGQQPVAQRQSTPPIPSRAQMIEVVADAFGASRADAERWLVEAFSEATA
ncbi:MAG: hypothetical protein A2143_05850 [Gallionellales bacterium RBG_16_57_15]|nr:MAG: hypothetical protein A2143_05850 [Gallionellales bacterium RBG_16_57_15]